MKKWIALATAATLLFGGSSAYAHGNGKDKKDKDWDDKEFELEIKDCGFIPPGLLKALENMKNGKGNANSRASIEANINKHKIKIKLKCDDQDWDDDWDDDDQTPTTDAQIVATDKAKLEIGFTGTETNRTVTGPITLPTIGAYGSAITWVSSNPAVVSNDGKTVVRQSVDTWVKLTATIRSNQSVAYKNFWVIVKKGETLTDAQKVAADKAALQIDFGGNDTAASVTMPFDALPTKGANGSTITWISGAPSIISADGKTVNRPAAGSGEATVVLIATIRSGNAVDTKIFDVKVQPRLADAAAVAGDKAALEIDFGGSDTTARVTRPFDKLPMVGANGSTITWTSSQPTVLSNDGKTVNRPASNQPDAPVILTAFIRSGDVTDTKIFVLTVANQFTAEETVDADKADLGIGFADNDSATSVTKSVTLASKGYYGSDIVWYSSRPDLIAHDGSLVKRPAKGTGDAKVTLTALLNSSGATEWRAFEVTVKQQQ